MKEESACQKNLENEVKLFTKEEKKDRIKKNYNPLKVNFRIYKRREEICMNDVILREIEKHLSKKGKIILHMFPKTFIKVYGIASKNVVNSILD